IPLTFAEERIRSVSHSFGTHRDNNGVCVWFHFLCKHIRATAPLHYAESPPEVRYYEDRHAKKAHILPQMDFSYAKSAFFLRKTLRGAVLVVFGHTQATRKLMEFTDNHHAWADAVAEPRVLLDLILDGLFCEVDDNVWNIRDVFGPMEHQILTIANSPKRNAADIPFVGLHNVSKHIIYLNEALKSILYTLEGAIEFGNTDTATPDQSDSTVALDDDISLKRIRHQLKDRLLYRRSLLRSTRLRLESLEKRASNATALAFNTVTQQDSTVMRRDSSTMKAIAVLTMLFLPTTAVASVMGSQLFLAKDMEGTWRVDPSPLFPAFWYTAASLTIAGLVLAALWQLELHKRWSRQEEAENSGFRRSGSLSKETREMMST
ncbi:hypothetical protein GQ53DRAFT_855747, partial [Thozetella sp. PMI_491]